MTEEIDDEFAFLNLPAGGIDVDQPPYAEESDEKTATLKPARMCSICGETQEKCRSGVTCKNSGSVLEIEREIDNRIMNPLTGTLVDLDDLDSLILGCVDAKKQLDDLKSFEDTLRRKLGEYAKGTAKTRRVQGRTVRAKLEMADDTWDQPMLKQAYTSYPKFRDDYLGIGTVSVKMREFKKLGELSTDDPAFDVFKRMLEGAVRPATGAPRVSLEK